MNIQVTEWLPPSSPCTERLYECTYCGGYMPGCCDVRDAHEVVLESAWRGIGRIDEWMVLDVMRIRAKGIDAWVQDWAGEDGGKEGDTAIFREYVPPWGRDTEGNTDAVEREVAE